MTKGIQAESRTKKSVRNILTGFGSKLLLMLFAFLTKTIFIRLLGAEYNGVNGLFTNILAVLSLSELGIGNVLNYNLYRALNDKDEKKVRSIVQYFKKIYRGIAFAILAVGLCLVPLLQFIVNSSLPQNEIIVYYILYLLNSVVSYFVVYKTTVITADQNNYISNIAETISTLVMYLLQIVYLLMLRDFLGYLIIQVLCTLGKNIALNFVANRKYPYLREGEIDNNVFDKKDLLLNVKATFLYKIAAVILNNTDNILISIIVGTIFVGYYSNYYMIVSYITAFITIFITGFTASLGNLNAKHDANASYSMFNILTLIFSFIGAIVACCLLNCMQPFVAIWIGSEYVMPFSWVIVIVFNLYITEIMNPVWIFRETMGLFKEVQYILLVTAALNIIFSIVFGMLWGVPGILIVTILSKIVTQYWYEPRILFGKIFHSSTKPYVQSQFKQIISCLLAIAVSYFVCSFLGTNIAWVLIRAVISAVIAIVIVLVFNFRTEAWRQLYSRYIKRVLIKLKR